jgi:uncharacterized membrane protein YfcA
MLELPFGLWITVLLVAIALVSGIGITTVGPGGIFVTIALYSLTPISSAEVAGTAHATFIATGLVGSAAYFTSGEFGAGESRAIAIVLSVASVAGALGGAYVNTYVSRQLFGILLGTVALVVGIVLLSRERRGLPPLYDLDVTDPEGQAILVVLGFALGGCSGLLGIGGPVIAVPALVLVGVPMLSALAAAQLQSIFIATFATAGYLSQGTVLLPLTVVISVPLLVGVVAGWKIAHLVDPAKLKIALGAVLIGVGPYLAL